MNDITINIPSDPFRTMIKTIIAEEQQPTLFATGEDNIERLKAVVIDTVINSSAVEDFVSDLLTNAADNSRSFRRAVEGAVEGCIDYSEIAANIEVREIADRISVSEVASEICLDSLADEINFDTVADALIERYGMDYERLAKALLREIRAEAAAKPNA